jgi:hypothetical protein
VWPNALTTLYHLDGALIVLITLLNRRWTLSTIITPANQLYYMLSFILKTMHTIVYGSPAIGHCFGGETWNLEAAKSHPPKLILELDFAHFRRSSTEGIYRRKNVEGGGIECFFMLLLVSSQTHDCSNPPRVRREVFVGAANFRHVFAAEAGLLYLHKLRVRVSLQLFSHTSPPSFSKSICRPFNECSVVDQNTLSYHLWKHRRLSQSAFLYLRNRCSYVYMAVSSLWT